MPSYTMREQNGNSCAAHCTVVAVDELTKKGSGMTADLAESDLWASIKFRPEASVPMTQQLAAANNSDPRRVVSEVTRRWKSVTAKLLCDGVQKNASISYVPGPVRGDMEALYSLLSADAINGPVRLDDEAFYNCSFTMHNAAMPSPASFTGTHNILVTLSGGKVLYYNPNETTPKWTATTNWKQLNGQNDGTHSYVFTGVCVLMT
jgi:hypothetical protein